MVEATPSKRLVVGSIPTTPILLMATTTNAFISPSVTR